MTNEVKNRIVSIVVDGRSVQAHHHEPLIKAVKRMGITIPSLCFYEDLEPLGTCRLCLVEVEKKGKRQFVTSCTYPVEDGLQIFTSTQAVKKHRQMVAEVLLARSPHVPAIQKLARDLGVNTTRFSKKDDTCILCGLCTSVCETYGTSALAVLNRGENKALGTFATEPPIDCVGCLACATLCPTGHITSEKTDGTIRIWERDIPIATCVVDRNLCRGCGACEEACPFSIPRVVLGRNRSAVAEIAVQACRGCGVCLAACPTSAISQPRRTTPGTGAKMAKGRILVVACHRSNLGFSTSPKLPDQADLVELPCTGGVNSAMILEALSKTYDGVLVLGRHQSTCRLDGAENHAREVVERMDELAQLAGLGPGRVVFSEPAPGPGGPVDAVHGFLSDIQTTPLAHPHPESTAIETLEGVFERLTWITDQDGIEPKSNAWLNKHGLPRAKKGKPVLYTGAIPYLDILLGEWLALTPLHLMLKDALAVLTNLGIEAGVAIGGFKTGEKALIRRYGDAQFYTMCNGCKTELAKTGLKVTTVNELLKEHAGKLRRGSSSYKVAVARDDTILKETVEALGFETTQTQPCLELGLKLSLSPAEREALLARLIEAEASGAAALIVNSPAELVQYLMISRQGAWQHTRVKPMLPSSLLLERPV